MAPGYADFPKDEYEQRFARARALMGEAGLDALLITERLNYIYFTGHRSAQNPIDKIRPYVFVLPKDEDCVLITMPFEVDQVHDTTWISDVRTAGLMGHAGFIASVLKDKGLGRARVGAELGREQYLGVSHSAFEEIRSELAGADFVDGAPVLLKLRAVKSPREIAYMRSAAEILATAEADTFATIESGITEIEISRVLRTRLAELGAENVTFLAVSAGVRPGGGPVLVPTERELRAGDTLVMDAGVEYRGYCADVARSAFVGEPSDEVAEFYGWMMGVRHRCNERLRAGSRPADVVTACTEELAERGLETMGVGRIGHGVGLETTEYPSLAIDEDIVFEPGMVFACNPNFVREFGFVNAEDNWAITEGDPELLSAPVAPDALPVVSVA